jgi:hydrogenase nickel incorporation protein HypA/HybF
MHELAVAQSIVDTVSAALKSRPTGRITTIRLRIGRLTDIAPEALQFGFTALTRDTKLAETSLIIDSVPIMAVCRACEHTFAVEDFRFVCPRCRAHTTDMVQGDELEIESMDIEDTENP